MHVGDQGQVQRGSVIAMKKKKTENYTDSPLFCENISKGDAD